MGRDKRTLQLSPGLTLFQHTLSIVSSHFCHVSVVGELSTELEEPTMDRLLDAPGIHGPMGGIVSGLRAFDTEPLFVVAVDMPGLSVKVIEVLLHGAGGASVERVVPEGEKGIEPLCGIYFPSALPVLEQAARKGEFGLQNLPLRERILPHAHMRSAASLTGWGLRSLNTPADVEAFKKLSPGDVLASEDTPM